MAKIIKCEPDGRTVKDLIEFLKQFDDDAVLSGEGVQLDQWKFEYYDDGKTKQLYFDL